MSAYPTLFALLLAGCLGADAGSSAPAPERGSGASRSETAIAAPTRAEDPDLRACIRDGLPPDDVELHVIGREAAGAASVLRVFWVEDVRDAAFGSDAILVVEGDACRRLHAPASETEWAAARSLSADPDVRDRQLAIQLEAAGGVDGLRDAIEAHRGADWIRPRECEFDENEGAGLCLGPHEAEAYRRAGIDIPRPTHFERFPGRADLSGVPDDVRTCVPPSARGQAGDVEYIGTSAGGAAQDLLFAVFGPDDVSVPDSRLHAASQDLDGRCTLVRGADRPTPDPARLYWETPTLQRRLVEIAIRRAGGPEAYGRLYRSQVQAGGPYACAPDAVGSDTVCANGPELEALRKAGVDVRPWPR